jgi:4-amino-4-deoxy-L-arabinose transferase-like glycosyltransferase
VWSGEEIARLAGERDPNSKLGADVDVNPIQRTSQPVVLNETDQQRAQIIRRYRLYSYQPDEMITFMALSTLRQARGDPKLYQYGGLWIYPVGALVRVFAKPRSDQAYYLDHPEKFGRFYVIARLYVVAWALVGAWAVFWIARKISNDLLIASAATVCYATMPVVVNMAHEAKPHLPGAVLILLAIVAATKFVETGRSRWAILTGILCGAAFGMVLSSLVGFLILPLMTLMRPDPWRARIRITLASAACGLAFFALTNPYVIVHLIHDREILISNLQNSRNMYRAAPSLAGLLNASYLIGAGATPLLAALGGFFAIRSSLNRNVTGWLLGIIALVVLLPFALFATGKPGEYARFAVLPDIALGIAAVVGIGSRLRARGPRVIAMLALCAFTGLFCASYLWHFLRDASPRSTRIIAAERLQRLGRKGGRVLAINTEPAPYSMPPVDLFSWKLLLSDNPLPEDADVVIRTVDIPQSPAAGKDWDVDYWIHPRLAPTPMSWASKPYELTIREPLVRE